MTKISEISNFLHFWIIKTVKGGFLVGSDVCPAFIMDDCDFIDYLLKVDQIGQDDYYSLTYSDFLRGDKFDIEQHLNNCLIEKKRILVEEHNNSKLTAQNVPFPSPDHCEFLRDHQRPTFSVAKIHIKTK